MAKPSLLDVSNFKDPVKSWNWDFGLVDAPRMNISAVKVENGRMYIRSFVLEGEHALPFPKMSRTHVELVIYDNAPQILSVYEYILTKLVDVYHDLDSLVDGVMFITHVYEYEFVDVR